MESTLLQKIENDIAQIGTDISRVNNLLVLVHERVENLYDRRPDDTQSRSKQSKIFYKDDKEWYNFDWHSLDLVLCSFFSIVCWELCLKNL